MKFTYIESPLGELLAVGDDDGLAGLYMATGTKRQVHRLAAWQHDDSAFEDTRTQLHAYFTGARKHFDVRLNATGNNFQRRVWNALCAIPYGTTTSYGKLAASVEFPQGARAVGVANAQNPISIIVPCHRVIGANGSLTGYAGGLEAKRFLLDHEAQHAGEVIPLFTEPIV